MEQSFLSFLYLCETLNYRKTAELMHLSQPAITKQIHSLESQYQVKLFEYANRRLLLTKQGEIMREYALSMYKCDQDLKTALKCKENIRIRVGVTKTVGDFYIRDVVTRYLKEDDREIEIVMDNTDVLIQYLKHDRIDLAVVEGIVDKSQFQTMLVKKEPFVGICSANHRFAGKKINILELENESVFLREEGSGTRLYLERELENVGRSIQMFSKVNVISNFGLLSQLVASGLGISFSYKAVADANSEIKTFTVKGFQASHEFNAIYLNHSKRSKEAQDFLDLLAD